MSLISNKMCCEAMMSIHGRWPKKYMHIGAHIGQEVRDYFLSGAEAIVWFEANPELIPRLHENVKDYPIPQQIFNATLWKESQETTLKLATNEGASSSIFFMQEHKKYYPDIHQNREINVVTQRFDEVWQQAGTQRIFDCPDYICIDTQGAELGIIEGMGDLSQYPNLMGFFIEVNQAMLYEVTPHVDEIDDYLKKYHFHRVKTEWLEAKWGNALYIKGCELVRG